MWYLILYTAYTTKCSRHIPYVTFFMRSHHALSLSPTFTALLLDGSFCLLHDHNVMTSQLCDDVSTSHQNSVLLTSLSLHLPISYLLSLDNYIDACMLTGMTPCTSSLQPSLRNSLRTTWGRVISLTSSSPSLTTTSRGWRCRRQPLRISTTPMW